MKSNWPIPILHAWATRCTVELFNALNTIHDIPNILNTLVHGVVEWTHITIRSETASSFIVFYSIQAFCK